MWRPKGLKNPISKGAISVRDRNDKPVSHYAVWELAASSTIVALRKTGLHILVSDGIKLYKGGELLRLFRTEKVPNGCTIVIIPDEEE